MLEFIKKQRVATWLTLAVVILAIASVSIYAQNGNMPGYFLHINSSGVLAMGAFAVIFPVAAIVLAQFDFEGLTGKVVNIVIDVLRILTVVFLMYVLMQFISTRVEGLAYIFFSDPSTLSEIQTPANMASAMNAIAGFIVYGITWLVSIVAVFFGMAKKK